MLTGTPKTKSRYDSKEGGPGRYASPITIFVIAIFVVLAYSNTFHSPFVFDDRMYITDNPAIRGFAGLWPPSGARYVAYLSFAVNYYFGGLSPFGFHVANIIIHILNSVLVFILVKLLFRTPVIKGTGAAGGVFNPWLIATSASVIFALHPVQTEAVTYIAQRFASLAALFYLLSVVLYLNWRLRGGGRPSLSRWLPYVLSIVSAILAMKTKEISFTLPFVIVFFELAFFGNDGFLSGRRRVFFLLPYLLTLFIIPAGLLLGGGAVDSGSGIAQSMAALKKKDLFELSMYEYLITQFRVIVTYMRLLIFPVNQNLYYDLPFFKSILNPEVIVSFFFDAAVFLFSVYLFIRSLKRGNGRTLLISTGILWFFMTLSVESSVVPIKDAIYEHRLYLPSVGAALALSSALFYFFTLLKRPRFIKKPALFSMAVALFLVVAVPLGALTYRRNRIWKDDMALWGDVAVKSPWSSLAHLNLAHAYYKRGRLKEAELLLSKATELNPGFLLPVFDLASLYMETKRFNEAIAGFKEITSKLPNNIKGHYNLGLSYAGAGFIGEALREYGRVLEINPTFFEVYYAIGDAYRVKGRYNEAVKNYSIFIKFAPDTYQLHKKLARKRIKALERTGLDGF